MQWFPGFNDTEQVMDKGIRQKSTKENSFTDGSAFCPGAPKRVPSDSEKHRRVNTSSNVCHSHEWRVDTAFKFQSFQQFQNKW